jgi:hypothetical protein
LLLSDYEFIKALLRLPLVGLLYLACSPSLFAGDLQFWNDLEYRIIRSGRFQGTLLGRLRFAETIDELYDRRAGGRLEYTIGNGVSVEAGYLFRNVRVGDLFVNENRLVTGISYPIVRRAVTVEGTTLYERHIVPLADFNRYKQEFEASYHEKPLSPWVYQQFTFKQGEGFVRSRSRVGIRFKGPMYSFKVAYQFESLSTGSAWTPRHTIYTELGIYRPVWKRE